MNTTVLRHQQDVSVVDAAATTLMSYLLLRIIQWIVTSNIFAVLGRVLFVILFSGIITTLLTSVPHKQKGLNNTHDIPIKKHV